MKSFSWGDITDSEVSSKRQVLPPFSNLSRSGASLWTQSKSTGNPFQRSHTIYAAEYGSNYSNYILIDSEQQNNLRAKQSEKKSKIGFFLFELVMFLITDSNQLIIICKHVFFARLKNLATLSVRDIPFAHFVPTMQLVKPCDCNFVKIILEVEEKESLGPKIEVNKKSEKFWRDKIEMKQCMTFETHYELALIYTCMWADNTISQVYFTKSTIIAVQ